MEYKHIFEPITVNGTTIKNRLAMAALSLVFSPDGYMNPRLHDFYMERAKGGVGLIVMGGCAIDEVGHSFEMVSLADDKFLDGLKSFTDDIHTTGAKICAQLFQNGRYARSGVTKHTVKGPSPVYSTYSNETPEEMTREDIDTVVKSFADAAVRAKKAGFDMVEISASAGYLLCQFLSPLTNLRTDEFGGSFENRCRVPVMVIKAVREAVGADYPVAIRVAGNDFVEGSCNNDDAVAFCKVAEAAGVDLISVTGGWHESRVPQITGNLPVSGYTYLAARIKKEVSVPVYCGNRNVDMARCEEMLAMGMLDGICMARPLICDPELPNKVLSGNENRVRRCIACEQGCMDHSFKGKGLGCILNPFAGFEYEMKFTNAAEPKKVLVVGGGAAGMQAAVTAAARGHHVTLWERQNRLGGQILYASAASGKQDFQYFTDYLVNEMNALEVAVELNKTATAADVMAFGADSVIIATGASPKTLKLENTGFTGDVVQANDILSGQVIAGKNVVVIGGGAVGCEAAVYLAERGTITAEQAKFLLLNDAESPERIRELLQKSERNVTIVEMLKKIGKDIGPGTRWVVMKEIRTYGIEKYTEAAVLALTAEGVRIRDAEGAERTIPADTVVIAVGSAAENSLYSELEGKVDNLSLIGDASSPRKLEQAVSEAVSLAMKI